MVFTYGDPGDAMFVIRTGEVEVFFKDDTWGRVVLETAGAGEFLDGGGKFRWRGRRGGRWGRIGGYDVRS